MPVVPTSVVPPLLLLFPASSSDFKECSLWFQDSVCLTDASVLYTVFALKKILPGFKTVLQIVTLGRINNSH